MAEPQQPLPKQQPDCAEFIAYDLTQWPMVVATIKDKSPGEAEFDAALGCFTELLTRDQPFCILFDVRQSSGIPLMCAPKLISFIRREKPNILRNLICSSIVLQRKAMMMLLDSVFAVVRPAKPNKRFRDREAAVAWMETFWE